MASGSDFKETAAKNDLENNALQMQNMHTTRVEVKYSDTDQGVNINMQRLQAPIFNIHIHVPRCEGKDLKMYLPRIQPVIHLHFDELARELKINRDQDEESTYKAFQNLLALTSPQFGDVKILYEDKPNESVNKELEVNTRTSCTSVNCSYDVDMNSERLENSILDDCEVSECCGSKSSSNDSNMDLLNDTTKSNKFDNSEETLKKKFKLKEAVVVLEDICKTGYYKNRVAANLRDVPEVIESEFDDEDCDTEIQESIHTESEEYVNYTVKREKECFSPEFGSPMKKNESIKINPLSAQSMYKSLLSPNKEAGKTNIISITSVTGGSKKTLSSLAEGCSFSEILSRFHQKKYNEETVNCFEDTGKSNISYEEHFDYKSVERIEEIPSCNGSVTTEENFVERDRINKDGPPNSKRVFYLEDHTYDISSKRKSVSSGAPNECEEVEPMNTTVFSPLSSESVSDDDKPSNSGMYFEIFSSSRGSQLKNDLRLPETRQIKLSNLGISDFQLDLRGQAILAVAGEMAPSRVDSKKKGRTGKDLKKKASEVESPSFNTTSPPKKVKKSDNARKKTLHLSRMEDYIPLEACGPTKFAVAPLNKVNPYQTHDARNFKKEMLFGKRVNRFSSPGQLRTYQVKQKAAKCQSH